MGNESIAFLKTEQNRLYCYAQNQSEAIKKRSLRVFLSQVPYFCYVLTANLMTLPINGSFFVPSNSIYSSKILHLGGYNYEKSLYDNQEFHIDAYRMHIYIFPGHYTAVYRLDCGDTRYLPD